MIRITFAFLLIVCYWAYGQPKELIHVRGMVTNTKGNALPFANVYLLHTSIGTVSNERGEFDFQFESGSSDTLVFSYLGYQRVYKKVTKAEETKTLYVKLQEAVTELQSVTITPKKLLKNPTEILRKAIARIPEMSNANPHSLEGYYRHTNIQDGSYRQLIEAAVSIYEPGFGKSGQRFNIDQFRRSHDLRTTLSRNGAKSSTKLTEVELREQDASSRSLTLPCWYRSHFIRQVTDVNEHGINTCGAIDFGLLNEAFLKEHRFKLDSITQFEDELVYVIKILPNASSKPYYTFPDNLIIPVGRVYIQTESFSVLKMEYQYILNPKKKRTDDFKTTQAIFGSGIIFKNTAIYREYDGKMYLSYLNSTTYSTTNLADRKVRSEKSNRVYNLTERTLLINHITTEASTVAKVLATKRWDATLYPEQFSYDEDFWKTFITLTETPDQQKMRIDLQKEVSLNEQFKRNQ